MKRNRNLALLVLLVFMIMILVSCSWGAKKSFLVTQSSFNDMVANYHQYYKTASGDERKKLRENINPKIIEALDILTKMNKAIRLEIKPLKIDQRKFQELRFELYEKLPKIFGKEG